MNKHGKTFQILVLAEPYQPESYFLNIQLFLIKIHLGEERNECPSPISRADLHITTMYRACGRSKAQDRLPAGSEKQLSLTAVMGSRTHYPKIWHLVKYIKLRNLFHGRSRKLTLTSPHPQPSSLKQVITLPCERYPPWTRRREDFIIIRNRGFGG